ncbi:MAG: trimethylamine methyltransferase family protein [Anaerolineales bacterium]|nr:trimethylamine methyltransferase family protein [Anaerolineales bacterium]
MKFTGYLLNEDEKYQIHQQSLRILKEVGVRVYGERALPLLAKSGAVVESETHIVRIPPGLVEHALSSAPRNVVLGARNPTYTYLLPSSITRYAMDGTGSFVIDFLTGERRYGTRKDIADAMRVFQEADLGVMAWPPVCALDAPAGSRPLHEFFTMAKFTSKHGQHELHTVEQVPYLLEGLEAIAGSAEALREKNLYSLIYCPVAPLTHDGPMLDAYLELGQAGLPVMVMPMPVTGTTGPASLFSNLALANAEALSAFVIFQLAHPGRPMIYSSATGSVDFRTGAYLAGTAEMSLQSAALVEMGRFYSLPTTSAGMTSDTREPGAEATLEKMLTTLPSVFVGSDIIVGYGEIESDQTLLLEQILVDNEIAHLCQRILQGIDTSPEKDLFGDIAAVGPGGHFLSLRSTRQAARSEEFYKPKFVNRQSYETWLSLGKPSLYSSARQKVQEILAAPLVDPLPEDISATLEDILRRADQELNRAN